MPKRDRPSASEIQADGPIPKQQYFDVILMENLDISDRIIALDTTIGAMHIEFSSVQRKYMHRESVELRQALDKCRLTDDTPKPIAQKGENENKVLVFIGKSILQKFLSKLNLHSGMIMEQLIYFSS